MKLYQGYDNIAKRGNLEKVINKYPKEVEIWLFKWKIFKMKISIEKSCHIIFEKKN
ncbi:hypothetical protein BpHYR1_042834 [Brachionus plicatilis]|uniref:Uncharacterized protein n=1 Tax=Brachionus plicatilis TaxID=10195 RepID=A0A3M7PX41_BRAPC|nr:hypothetical protein BpHYR1_042834 [Brachionus plicatilis]